MSKLNKLIKFSFLADEILLWKIKYLSYKTEQGRSITLWYTLSLSLLKLAFSNNKIYTNISRKKCQQKIEFQDSIDT